MAIVEMASIRDARVRIEQADSNHCGLCLANGLAFDVSSRHTHTHTISNTILHISCCTFFSFYCCSIMIVYKYGHVIGAVKCQHGTSQGISHFSSATIVKPNKFQLCAPCFVRHRALHHHLGSQTLEHRQ